ncbi:Photosystem II core complex protein psbY [Dorcoceras hygrometricum]|uniref:Photosystem II core complex protein psbY n=1 Tax=Dorcoceras hygrometricum TaxID=472368 RepID=A0A2Z7A0A6_9LAMI|nr:Photosystem II core complex protein psbY [Dorcoceras hygrometricum]
MAATTMATILNTRCLYPRNIEFKPTKPVLPLLSMATPPKGLAAGPSPPQTTASLTAGLIFSSLAGADPAFSAQQLAELADSDNRGLALLIPLVPALLWVLYNILQPALNQINKMRNSKGVIIGLGLGGLATSGFFSPLEASAGEIAAVAEAASDNRGQLLLLVLTPAILWVLYNILQPALNQINRMRK